MFAGLVDNLGLKEGLAEFKEQFNKDAKATIAETQFARDRGIDLAKLDAWEQKVQEQTEAVTAEWKDRTIGLAVETLTKDETLAQLFDFRAAGEGDEGAADGAPEGGEDDGDSAAAAGDGDADDQADADAEGAVLWLADTAAEPSGAIGAEAAAATSSASASGPHSAGAAGSRVGARAGTGAGAGSAVASAAHVSAAAALPPPAPGAGVPGAQSASPAWSPQLAPQGRLNKLDLELRQRRDERATVEALLANARAESAALEARWNEMAGVSRDAVQQAAGAAGLVADLRRALEERDAKVAAAQDKREQLEGARLVAIQRRGDLEAAFQERLEREVSQKEQELLEEVGYLRKTQELKEKKLRDLASEKEALERKAGGASVAAARAGLAARGSERVAEGPPIEPHVALARAAGHIEAGTALEHPLLAMLDAPSLRLSAMLLKRPLLRHLFFLSSILAWALALRSALAPGQTHMIVV